MGLFDSLKNTATSAAKSAARSEVNHAINNAVNEASKAAYNASNKHETFTFEKLPANLAELQAMSESSLQTPFMTAALTIAVMTQYNVNEAAFMEMYDWLNGPNEITTYQKQFLKEHLGGKQYVINSYFEGTSPENNYTPSVPYKVVISDNPYSYQDGNYATLWVTSSGADSPRCIKLRQKPSTGQWFLNEQMLLAGIRIPVSEDEWA